jgi:cytochrome c oxidase assembly factor CtaG
VTPWYEMWSLTPLQVAPVALGTFLYAVRARRLGSRIPGWRIACFAGGVFVLLMALVSPIDEVGEQRFFWVHMLQHVMIGDIAPLLILLGITGPILRPVLAMKPIEKLRALTNPLVALPLWALNLYLWHFTGLYELALQHDIVHALEHICFFAFGMLMWAPIIEPLPAPAWFGTGPKIAYVGVVRALDAILGNIFWWSGSVFYSTYAVTAPRYGLPALEDQADAGTIMMAETGIVTLVLLLILFFRMAKEGETRQALIERGLDPEAVKRAVRYGRADVLAARHGVSLDPPG